MYDYTISSSPYFASDSASVHASSLELVLKGKKDKCPAPTFPCFCFVDLLTVFLVQGQRQVSSFWSGQGLTLCVCDAAQAEGLRRGRL